MAAGALRALRGAGRRVPDDVAVVGFDDAAIARTCDPPLATVAQPLGDMTALMGDLLLRRIEHGDDGVEARVCHTTWSGAPPGDPPAQPARARIAICA